MPQEIKVAITEDQQQTREGLATLINGTSGYRTTGVFSSMEQALARIEGDPPDVILLDIHLPGMTGIEGAQKLRARYPALQILILTIYADSEHIFEAICAGASGYLLKDTPPSKLLDAIRELHEGGAPMSPDIARKVITMFHRFAPPVRADYRLSARELEVLRLLGDGHSYKTAAVDLNLSADTIRFHIRNIYEKLHVHSKSEAVLKAFRVGLLR